MSLLSCQRSPFGPAAPTRLELMGIRFADLGGDGGGAGGDDDKGGGGNDDDKGDKKHTDADVERIVQQRLERDRRERQPKPKDEPKPKPKDAEKNDDDAPKGLTQEDVDKKIQEALDKQAAKIAVERAGDALDAALEGRTFSASLVRSLDVAQFVKDGKTDAAAIKDWVEKNSKPGPTPRPKDPGQGGRDGNATGGTTQAGRDLFEETTKKTKKE